MHFAHFLVVVIAYIIVQLIVDKYRKIVGMMEEALLRVINLIEQIHY